MLLSYLWLGIIRVNYFIVGSDQASSIYDIIWAIKVCFDLKAYYLPVLFYSSWLFCSTCNN